MTRAAILKEILTHAFLKIPLILLLAQIEMQAMINVQQKALQNIQKAQCRQKVYYDTAHNIDKGQYKVGAVVLLRNKTKKGSKMETNWIGPYFVHEVLSKGTCRLSSKVKKPNKVLAQKFNISCLKQYHQNGLLTMS